MFVIQYHPAGMTEHDETIFTEPSSRPAVSAGRKPAYGAVKPVLDLIAAYAEAKQVPSVVTSESLPHLERATRSHLLGSLNFLGLIDADGQTTVPFLELLAAWNTPDWKPTLRRVLQDAYAGALADDLDFETVPKIVMTSRLSRYGNLRESVAERAASFFVLMRREAGVEPRTTGARKRSRQLHAADPGEPTMPAPDHNNNVSDHTRIKLVFKGEPFGVLEVPDGLTQNQLRVIEAHLEVLRLSAKPEPNGQG